MPHRNLTLSPSVTLAEIKAQQEKGWPDFDAEDYCHRCGGRNLVWSIDSDRWNLVMRPSAHEAEHCGGIVCPGCFVDLHEQATGLYCVWALEPASQFRHREATH